MSTPLVPSKLKLWSVFFVHGTWNKTQDGSKRMCITVLKTEIIGKVISVVSSKFLSIAVMDGFQIFSLDPNFCPSRDEKFSVNGTSANF